LTGPLSGDFGTRAPLARLPVAQRQGSWPAILPQHRHQGSNSAHVRQSRPDSEIGVSHFQSNVFKPFSQMSSNPFKLLPSLPAANGKILDSTRMGYAGQTSCFYGFGLRLSAFGFRPSAFGFWLSAFSFRLLAFDFRVSNFGVSGFRLRSSGFRFRLSDFEVAGMRFRISTCGFQGFGFQVSGFGIRVSGFGFRVEGGEYSMVYAGWTSLAFSSPGIVRTISSCSRFRV
jgi:hypothetical protein